MPPLPQTSPPEDNLHEAQNVRSSDQCSKSTKNHKIQCSGWAQDCPLESSTRENNILDLLITSIVEGVSNINVIGCEGVALKSAHKVITFDLHFWFRSQN